MAGALASPAAAATDFPSLTGLEFKALYYGSLPLPGTQSITARPPIYGHAAADLRIQRLAEQRGYRLQVTPTVPLGSYGGVTLATDAGRAWESLLDAARRNGTPLQGNSGYRSVATQREIFRRRLGGYSTAQIASGAADAAIESVLAYHSIPGYSRHHTGKTLDLSAAGGANGSFAATA
ncbi:MAG: D-alanyl-D-alanine carboxypeptidase family protein, partial [Acidimicrobiales bacterium]